MNRHAGVPLATGRSVVLKECSWRRVGTSLLVMFDPARTVRLADPDGRVERLLEELAAVRRQISAVHAALVERGDVAADESIDAAIATLDGLGLVEDGATASLEPGEDPERHASTLAFFSSFASLERGRADFVRRLRGAHVLQLGAGGIGSAVVQALCGMGVGGVTIVDHDTVAVGNLARQFLYRRADLGRPKVERAVEWIDEVHPTTTANGVMRRVRCADDVADLLDGVDVVVCAIDVPSDVGLRVGEAATPRRVPSVHAGVGPFGVRYGSVLPGRSACLSCVDSGLRRRQPPDRASAEYDLAARLHRPNPSTASLVMLAGSLVSLEVVRLLTGFQAPQAAGARVTVRLDDGLVPHVDRFDRDAGCPVCGGLGDG
ncbi:ThiF family adenylyltransferase [Virgisporangium ochraceum]